MTTLKVQRIGDEIGVILPATLLAELSVREGDSLDVAQVPAGVVLTRYTPEKSRQIERALEAMDAYAPALAELAK